MTADQAVSRPRRKTDPSAGRGAVTYRHVLSTSTTLFSEQGFAATTMRHLANRADLPISAFYYYFSSKYEVLLDIMNTVIDELTEAVHAVDGDCPPADRLAAMVAAHVRYHVENPHSARVTDRELRSLTEADLKVMLRRRHAYEQPFKVVLGDGVANGDFVADLDQTVARNVILTMSTSVLDWWKPSGSLSVADVSNVVAAYAVRLASGP